MSRVAGDFLGETFAGDGAISDAPELTEDVGAWPERGRFPLHMRYRHRRHQSFFPLRNRNRKWRQKAGRGWRNQWRRARLAVTIYGGDMTALSSVFDIR